MTCWLSPLMIFFWEKLLRRRCVAMSNSFPSRMNHLNILNYSSLSVGQLPSISIHRVIFHEKWWCSVEQFMKIHWKFWIIPLNTWWFSIEHVDFAWKFHSKMVKFPFFHGFFMAFWRFQTGVPWSILGPAASPQLRCLPKPHLPSPWARPVIALLGWAQV